VTAEAVIALPLGRGMGAAVAEGMTRWTLAALATFASSLVACGGAPDDDFAPPTHDAAAWAPFEQGEISEGELGRSRFQIASCGHPELVGLLPSCGLDLPFIAGSRAALLVETEGRPASGLTLRSTGGGALVVDSVCPEGDYLRALVTAAGPGSSSLVVRSFDGVEVDRIVVDVREAASVAIERDEERMVLAPGERTTLQAIVRSDEGEMLNVYAGLRWRMLDGTGALRLHGTRGWRVEVEALEVGDERLRTEVGLVGSDLAMVVE